MGLTTSVVHRLLGCEADQTRRLLNALGTVDTRWSAVAHALYLWAEVHAGYDGDDEDEPPAHIRRSLVGTARGDWPLLSATADFLGDRLDDTFGGAGVWTQRTRLRRHDVDTWITRGGLLWAALALAWFAALGVRWVVA